MSYTLRITSVLAAACAVILAVIPSIFGYQVDEQIQNLISLPSVVASFKTGSNASRSSQEADLPLVKQARAFARYLNPPPKARPKRPPTPSRAAHKPRPPAPVEPKFKLLGTSFYADRPELSLALIAQPGTGLRWVRQASEVGHLIIEQVKDGSVILRDGQRTFELSPQRPMKPSLIKGQGQKAASAPTSEGPGQKAAREPLSTSPAAPDVRTIAGRPRTVRSVSPASKLPAADTPEHSDKEMALYNEFFEQVKSVEDPQVVEQRFEELTQKLAELGRISDEEAEHLDQFGQELDQAQHANDAKDSDKADSNQSGTDEADVNDVDANEADADNG